MFVNNTIVCASVDQCNTCDTPIFRQNGPHDGGVIFPLKTDKNMYLYLVSCDCAGFVHQVFFLSVPMFLLYLVKNCVLPGFQTLQVHETSVFTVYSVLCYFTVFLHWYLQFTSVFTWKFTPSLPHGAPLSFFCWYLRCLNCCFALWTSNDFFEAFQKNRGIYLQIIPIYRWIYIPIYKWIIYIQIIHFHGIFH